MADSFFERPILNSPYEYSASHWELDKDGQPTNVKVEQRRRAQFITPIPKAKKRKQKATQEALAYGDEIDAATNDQKYALILMDFLISDTFTASLAKLTGDEQKARHPPR